MNYIHLKHYHRKRAKVKHPVFIGCKKVEEEELNRMAEEVIAGGSSDDLVLALRWYVGALVGRYIWNFPQTKKYKDDMVSEALEQIVNLCVKIPEKLFREKGILKLANSRAQRAIEDSLNSMLSLSAPSRWKQWEIMNKGETPIFLTSSTSEYFEDIHPEDGGDELKRDILDAFIKIEPEDEIDEALMDEHNWGRNATELAEELGVDDNTIYRRRERLYKKYLELIGEEYA